MSECDEDRELVAQARAGSLGAFDELVRRHGPALYRFAWRNTHDAAAAEELTREACGRAWREMTGLPKTDSTQTPARGSGI